MFQIDDVVLVTKDITGHKAGERIRLDERLLTLTISQSDHFCELSWVGYSSTVLRFDIQDEMKQLESIKDRISFDTQVVKIDDMMQEYYSKLDASNDL